MRRRKPTCASLPGVGPKTAACVLAFAMGRAAFPVDTHVHRIVTRLGWIPAKTTAEQAHRLLAAARAARHPVRPARRDDRARAHGLPGAAATLRRMRPARPVRVRFGAGNGRS